MDNYQTELTVAEAYEDDVGRGVGRIDPDSLLELKLSPGDICLVEGNFASPVKVWRSDRGDWESGKVFLDEFTRVNTQADVDTEVELRTVETSVAQKITLQWYRGFSVDFGSNATRMIKKQWVKRPVSIGDVLPVMVDKEGHEWIPLVIGDIEPEGVSVIRDNTDIRINTD